ncbi:type II toxin-antitoxin system HicA family toxin [Lactobacillus apis]|uniref:Type II toxin-antitoxin system HicA family toxin n=1 Tax=Lactobacillus apis TaxID=303541 RepID=A0A0F4LQ47_9LACO|nr:type II toxin-antitoxin system HicA family toxin [Lactobacillus apis]KJY59691.1 uncharacterized protein JF72_15300 [Lactobacillus apis]
MNKSRKLVERFKKKPKDFTYQEAKTMLEGFGFKISNKGKTSGSRVLFRLNDTTVLLHKPHPFNYIKRYKLDEIEAALKEVGKL